MASEPEYTVSLKEHLEKIIAANDRRYSEVAIEKDRALSAALASAKEAVSVADKNADEWRKGANEWRGAMTDRERNFIPRSEFEGYKQGVDKALNIEKERGDIGKGRGDGKMQLWGLIIGAVGFASAVIAIASRFF